MADGRNDLTEFELKIIQPLLPNKLRGVPRVDNRRVLNGIFPSSDQARLADLPVQYGPCTTVYNRFDLFSINSASCSLFGRNSLLGIDGAAQDFQFLNLEKSAP